MTAFYLKDEDLSKTIFSNENGRYSHVHRGRENGGGNGNINADDKSFLSLPD